MQYKFKEFRENLGITQLELSRSINYSLAYIKKIEAGERKGSIDFWKQLQKVYNIDNSKIWGLIKND